MFKFWKRDKISTLLSDTFIGEGTIVEGPIRSAGNVRLEGQLRGDLFCEGDAVLGETAFAIGNITARNLFLAGQVTGNVRIGGKLTITATGKFYGDMDAATLEIEEGGVFQGNSAMDMGEPVVSPVERRAGRDRRLTTAPDWKGEERRSGYDRRDREDRAGVLKKLSYRAMEKGGELEAAAEEGATGLYEAADAASAVSADPLRESGRAFMQSMHAGGKPVAPRGDGISENERAALGMPGSPGLAAQRTAGADTTIRMETDAAASALAMSSGSIGVSAAPEAIGAEEEITKEADAGMRAAAEYADGVGVNTALEAIGAEAEITKDADAGMRAAAESADSASVSTALGMIGAEEEIAEDVDAGMRAASESTDIASFNAARKMIAPETAVLENANAGAGAAVMYADSVHEAGQAADAAAQRPVAGESPAQPESLAASSASNVERLIDKLHPGAADSTAAADGSSARTASSTADEMVEISAEAASASENATAAEASAFEAVFVQFDAEASFEHAGVRASEATAGPSAFVNVIAAQATAGMFAPRGAEGIAAFATSGPARSTLDEPAGIQTAAIAANAPWNGFGSMPANRPQDDRAARSLDGHGGDETSRGASTEDAQPVEGAPTAGWTVFKPIASHPMTGGREGATPEASPRDAAASRDEEAAALLRNW